MRKTSFGTTLLTVVLFAACGGEDPVDPGGNGGGGGGGGGTPASAEIRIVGNSFSPEVLTVQVGNSVAWINDGGGHTITPQGHTQWQGRSISGGGEVLRVTFSSAGTFNYVCTIHAGMDGTVIVQ